MKEIPAQGVTGFLLYDHIAGRHFFRVYESPDKKTYTDYQLRLESLKIEIKSNNISLYEDGRLDYSSEYLHLSTGEGNAGNS